MAADSNRQKDVFLKALDIASPAERAAFLAEVCAGDPVMRQQIEALLDAHAKPDSFLEKPAALLAATVDARGEPPLAPALPDGHVGTRIGPYELLEQVGEGGMGAVYLAEQNEPMRRTVALKIIKPGMDSAQVLARFEAERQALALMDHPNIAKVLDAGTTPEGRPYFVMELVRGKPITKFCDERRLSPRERLEMFVLVCQAIQHAHQKGVIHRDIKPSNVLVALYDDKPTPKVIDFGIAKAAGQLLTEKTLNTGFGAIVGTPEYMSPEQATFNQLDIDTRSDVYALGVLLYELLTGSTPVDKARLKEAALLEVLRIVREEEPPRPSMKLSTSQMRATIAATRGIEADALSRLLRGELDWIVMKALEKERARRYDSAAGLARDVERFLKDELVESRPPTAGYRLGKFVQRNRGMVTAASLVLLAVVLGIIGTTWGLLRALDAETEVRGWFAEAREQERKAKAESAEVRRLVVAETAAREKAEQNKLRAETARQAIVIDQARRAWEGNDVGEAERVLATVDESFRKAWETRFLADLCRRKARPFAQGLDIAHCELAFAGNAPRLAGITRDGTIHSWDPASNLLRRSSTRVGVPLVKSMPNCLALSRDGRYFAGKDDAGAVKIWEAKANPDNVDFKLLKGLILTDSHFAHLAFSPDSQNIVGQAYLGANEVDKDDLGCKNKLVVWDVATGQEKLTLIDAASNSAVWTQDGRLAYIGLDGGLWLRNLATGAAKAIIKNVVRGEARPVYHLRLAISSDGKRAATADQGVMARVWDTVTGQELCSVTRDTMGDLHFEAAPRRDLHRNLDALALSGNGRWLAASVYGKAIVQVWDAETGKLKATLLGDRRNPVTSLAISDDGLRVLAGWPSKYPLYAAGEGSNQTAAGQLWDLTARPEKLVMNNEDSGGPVPGLAISRNGNHIVSASWHGKAFAWDGATGKKKFTIPTGREGSEVRGLTIDREGKTLFCAGPDGRLHSWDMTIGKENDPSALATDDIVTAAFTNDGRYVFTGGITGMVRKWDLVNRRQELAFQGYDHPIVTFSLSGDAKRLAVLGNFEARVWDVIAGRKLVALTDEKYRIDDLALSPDGQVFVTGGTGSTPAESLKVYALPSGQLKFLLKGHTGNVVSVAVTPDGERIISASKDGTVRLWDMATGQEMLALNVPGYSTSLAVSGDGRRIVAGGNYGTITVWEAP